MKIKIICFGKLDKKFFIQAFDDYLSRVNKFCDLEVIELKEEFNGELNKVKEINSQLLINKINNYKDYEKIILDVNSKLVSSEELALKIQNNKDFKSGKLLFVIGPSDGYTDQFKSMFNNKISLAKITLPHQLFRVVLIEQIYRSFKIINNEKYHK
ncbi:23S rRNA (pseudouridine(1915)-N(3))-methyltransferase RlmH [Vibrio harveyi]|uniref:23S rRNA (pseudouridine(1915)-N(3))-methyltransferase RlmH n=1 Tax=Mycoplasma yeatsii TaxID=51365 RepID=UPI0005B24560|nr:23S rRNA (pseudouridine(1915)-N(3))-methyltransferase RlmH [Mycoplasma yeatsii]AJM71848.1 50S rRNA methyltransferase [Mycoplasma yeatsii GM274B]MBY7703601.1 23S rRNA (pseudouridine(1915)-N(3))-methyltransferase RlmH [Vibrio harveyi]